MISGEEIIRQIEKGNIVIEPFNKENIRPNSYVLHMNDELVVYEDDIIECKKENKIKRIKIPKEGYLLQPGELYLSRTLEYTETFKNIPLLNGRFGLAALGVVIHITAGFGDNGFKGTWTLEIFCTKPTRIYPNMKVAQISYFAIVGNDEQKYQGKYLNQIDTTPSRMYKEEIKNN